MTRSTTCGVGHYLYAAAAAQAPILLIEKDDLRLISVATSIGWAAAGRRSISLFATRTAPAASERVAYLLLLLLLSAAAAAASLSLSLSRPLRLCGRESDAV